MEAENELDAHITDIQTKFVAIINDACKPAIEAAATSIDWDAPIEKNQVVNAASYVEATVTTLFSMIKILCQVLQLTQAQIEDEILETAMGKIVNHLHSLFVDKTALFCSRFAKKRMKVDLKSFIHSVCDDTKPQKFTSEFKQKHFLLTSEGGSKIKETLIEIFTTRCGVKREELAEVSWVDVLE